LDEAGKITPESILGQAGEVPPVKKHCAIIGAEALHKAIEDYRKKS
ncbi:MAG TPA: iron-sulfur cluster assembly scaffold protein, partial [Candidatus Portnoybacteria bacterium]|nr:iron-sulfur cluster assembly scaffold protein [Candidatus Portnoybacteria bacterium]